MSLYPSAYFWKQDKRNTKSINNIAYKLQRMRTKISKDHMAKLLYGIETSMELQQNFLLEMDTQ